MRATDKLQLQYPSGMTVRPVLASSTGTQTLEVRGEKKKGWEASTRHVCAIQDKPPVRSIIQSFPPSFCNPGLYSGGIREGTREEMCVRNEIVMVELIVPDDQRGNQGVCRSDNGNTALECWNGMFRRDWLWCISWQGLDGPGQ